MPRRRRRIFSNHCYEICFRARNSLPLIAYRVIALIIGASIARTQRDDKVVLCHDIWNGSHSHIIVVSKDAASLVAFYGEIQKRITDALKRLLGLDYLSIWEGEPMVALIGDLEKAKERIAYLYANPAQDNLESSIDKFPGYSSWKHFLACKKRLGAIGREIYPWIRLPSIPTAKRAVLTPGEDASLVRRLKSSNKHKHTLIREPNAWMKCFGVEFDEEVEEINKEIIADIREREQDQARKREKEGKQVLGSAKLRTQPILNPHKPKKKERKVFIITSCNELRMKFIEEFKEFCALCREAYLEWMRGNLRVSWPPGAFLPPIPPNVSLVELPV